ncbi:MAG: MATE family efflux transporter [Lachnospiraceae bacterium]|nr:MATE family efflux transporter [Lachnospiraceae bacterium]
MSSEISTPMFSGKDLKKLILPMVIEQVLAVTVGIADTMMVSMGSAGDSGDAVVSGISLVNSINVLLIMVFAAMASGGSVVVSQLIGTGDKKRACKGANQEMLLCVLLSTVIMVIALVFNRPLLRLIFGAVEEEVMKNAIIYFYITALSFPFLATYNAGASLFRVMGNSRISLNVSIVMNIINILGNAVLVLVFHMGVAGVGISTLLSRAVAAVYLLVLIRNPNLLVHIDEKLRLGFEPDLIKKIFAIGIPMSVENGMFQVGKLITQRLITSFGTASIAANALAATIEMLADIPGAAMGLALVTVVGRCVGAGEFGQAKHYTGKLLKICYVFMIMLNAFLFLIAGILAKLYHLSPEATVIAIQLIRYHSICAMLIWPLAFTISSALKASGDAQFTMWTSIGSMWIFRIGFAYILGKYVGLGVLGVWIAMTIDWLVRGLFNITRFLSGKWQEKALVRVSPTAKAKEVTA